MLVEGKIQRVNAGGSVWTATDGGVIAAENADDDGVTVNTGDGGDVNRRSECRWCVHRILLSHVTKCIQ